MKVQIVKNKYVNGFLLLLLLAAIIHFGILCISAVQEGQLSPLNFFKIIQVDYFFPVSTTLAGNIFALIFTLILYVAILYVNK